MSAHALCEIFKSHLPHKHREVLQPTEVLELRLEACWEVGRGAWQGLQVPAPLFTQYLAEHVDCSAEACSEPAILAALDPLCLEDLYLACACVHQIGDALQMFERNYISRIPSFLSRLHLQPSKVEDIQQGVRERLLVGRGDTPPKLATYKGHGRLTSWVGAVAVRTAHNENRSKDEQNERAANIAERLSDMSADPALESMKRRYGAEFKQVLQEVIGGLSAEQRNLLRYYYVKGLTTTQIGALFNMNQSSASRRLSSLRETILSTTKRLLRERLKLTESDFSDLAELVQSQINLSLSRLLSQPESEKD